VPIKILPRPTDPVITPPTTTTPPPVKPGPDTPTTKPPTKPAAKLGAPKGSIPVSPVLKIAFGRGGPWSLVNEDDPHFLKYGAMFGVDPAWLKAMEVVETGGRMIPNTGGSGAWGSMQIKESDWGWVAKKYDFDLKTREGQVATAAAIVGRHGKGSTVEERFLESYYPVRDGNGKLCLDCKGEDGHTPRQYLADIRILMGIINDAAGITPPIITPKPKLTEKDVLLLLTKNPQAYISFGFSIKNTQTSVPIYKYGAGHGLPAGGFFHTGIDVWTPDETPIYNLFDGKVTCVGTQGEVTWDQGCGSFVDDQHGVGNLTVLCDAYATISGKSEQLKLTYGHMSTAKVKLGDRIKAGQQLGTSGVGIQWPHVHLDVVINAPELNNPQIWFNGGAYHLVDPIETIINAMQGSDVHVEPLPELMKFTYLASPNYMSRQGRPIRAIVYHISDSMNLQGTLDWLRQRGSDASSHWVIDRNGDAYQLVGSAQAAFTNGPLLNPRQDIPWLRNMPAGDNANWYTITIEHIGTPDTGITPEQFETSSKITRYYLPRYQTINRDRSGMMRHADFACKDAPPYKPDPTGKISRCYCPGDKFPLRELILSVGGNPDAMAA
jgi:murein DD-endopeptidase MepM/ murein hydrolase activator NlpD